MACGCNKAKKVQTTNSTKKVDISAAQKKVASLPLISTPRKATQPLTNKISPRQK
jgi:hypothetical protein